MANQLQYPTTIESEVAPTRTTAVALDQVLEFPVSPGGSMSPTPTSRRCARGIDIDSLTPLQLTRLYSATLMLIDYILTVQPQK